MNIGEYLGGQYIKTNTVDPGLSSIARYSIDVSSPSSVILNISCEEKQLQQLLLLCLWVVDK